MIRTIIRSIILTTSCLYAGLTLAQLPGHIRLTTGLIEGTPASNADVMVFRGIPYAAPPIGDNRWRPPQPPATWSGVRPATEFGPRCVQGGFAPGAEQPLSSEDCLYLNVWTPAKSQDELLPVMMWIHGGGFFTGSGSSPLYDSQHLAAKGAVVVTINYRLGTFGFFAHPELTAESPNHSSGNYAMLDAIAALEWIYDNIAAFGGDPTNVTVFGESAGAVAVHNLIGSPLSRGLIHRVILQSRADGASIGIPTRRQPTLAEMEAAGVAEMRKFGASSLAELRAASAQDIFENFPTGGQINVDGWFMPEQLSQVFADGEQHLVYVLAGSNRDEANFFGPGLPSLAAYRDAARMNYGNLADNLMALYPAGNDQEANLAGKKAFNDEMNWLARRLVAYQAELGFNSFVYYFTHVPPGGEARGATHVSELAYVFNQYDRHPEWTDADRKLADVMSSYWVNFARRSTPNGRGVPNWPAFTGNEPGNVLILGDEVMTEKEMAPSAKALELFDRAHQQSLE